MKKLFMVLPLVFLLCIEFSCKQREERANPLLEQTKIAFMSNRHWNIEIYVMNTDGSKKTNLTNNPVYARSNEFPSWSPDGEKIAFVSWRDANLEIYVMNADGSEQKNLTNNPDDDESPSWSPDGKKIAFTSYRDKNCEIYVMNVDGGEQTNLTKSSAEEYNPSWSPYLKPGKGQLGLELKPKEEEK